VSARRSTKALCAALAGAAWLFVALPGEAQTRDAAAAEVLFREGRKAQENNDHQEACQKFGESQRLDPAPGTLMNLATCEEKLGKLASAWQHWREALDTLPPGDARAAFAKGRVRELESKLPRLTVVLTADEANGARVFRDDVELGRASLGAALPVDPGSHTVTVMASGHRPESVGFSMAEGEERKLEVHPGAVELDSAATDDDGARSRNLGWVLGGLGVLGLGTAVLTGALLANANSLVEADCPNKMCRTQAGVDAASSGQTLLVVNGAAWIAGGLGLGVGAYLILSNGPPTSSTGLVPAVGPNGASLSYRGTF
jgi:tetratricopeptide (TPR) repeat protein